jgi:DNA-binding protein HU-beta
MNKMDLVNKVAEQTGLKKKDAELAVNSVFGAIEEALAAGEKVQVIGFGTFETRQRSARSGRNPQTGETISIPASTVPAFKPGNRLKDITK